MDDMRTDTRMAGRPCAQQPCPYDDTAYSLDEDGLCLNCSDDRARDVSEMESEIRQEELVRVA